MIDIRKLASIVPESRPFILFIRHARRPNLSLTQMVKNEALSILPEGAAEARQLGFELRHLKRPILFFTSPLNRCVQTCQEISKGWGLDAKESPNIRSSRYLGDPSAYVIEAEELGTIMQNYDNPVDFLSSWFRGEVPERVILPPKKGSKVLLRWFIQLLKDQEHVSSRAIIACISHDLIITAFLASLFEYDYKKNGVVDYLDGVALWMESPKTRLTPKKDKDARMVAYFSNIVKRIEV